MSYWTYEGSLTTPPLYESVTWIVFKKPMTVSKEQLDAMRSLKCHGCFTKSGNIESVPENVPLMDNFRPPQPIKERIVRQVKL